MVNLKEKPYYLNEEQIRWVEDTIAGMTAEEKIGYGGLPAEDIKNSAADCI